MTRASDTTHRRWWTLLIAAALCATTWGCSNPVESEAESAEPPSRAGGESNARADEGASPDEPLACPATRSAIHGPGPDSGGADAWSGRVSAPEGGRMDAPALTPEALFRGAFERYDACQRDCQGFARALLADFDVTLPERPDPGAASGTFTVDLRPLEKPHRALALLDDAQASGAVLLHLEGEDGSLDWALYLGRDDARRPHIMHALPRLQAPCEADPERAVTWEVSGLSVSELDTKDGAGVPLLERLHGFTVVGDPPGVSLQGVAALRAPRQLHDVPDACEDHPEAALFLSPRYPNTRQPLRVIAATSHHPGPSELVLVGPEGQRHRPELRHLGGPPYGRVVTLPEEGLSAGAWTAMLGEGDRVVACERFEVRGYGESKKNRKNAPVWEIRRTWDESTENLYALFIESLFDYPLDEEARTWHALHPLIRDPERNLLYHHRFEEEDQLWLYPDCADLSPYLRGLFSWKLGLPFGFHYCTRGGASSPASCGRLICNDRRRKAAEPIDAFRKYIRRAKRAVHSASGLTRPEETNDFYPVKLEREAIVPGTIFTDPYDHVMIVVGWIPQPLNGTGILMTADAQSNTQIGRRRFWPGNFLFNPEVGGAFQRHRPVQPNPRGYGRPYMPDNAELEALPWVPLGYDQYAGSAQDFYDAMRGLINPRPLDPFELQETYTRALHEQLVRRVDMVQRTQDYLGNNGYISMPRSIDIFSTTGDWEAHSTPSRDLRMLIAMDIVLDIPKSVRRHPERYDVDPDNLDSVVAELKSNQRALLERFTFDYTRSDGSTWTLTLADIVDRRKALEIAYNPNDCPEIRWGADLASREGSTCKRRAPERHTRRMVGEFRKWFKERRRPRILHD